jgi:chaperonin GroEL (HSP60 family)
LLINHLGKLFVTSDAATIIREVEVVHPAAKLLVLASQAQEAEVCAIICPSIHFSPSVPRRSSSHSLITISQMGDATNTVIILAGELLKKAEHLLIMGLHPSEITKGYELGCAKALEELESMIAPVYL